MRLGSGIIGPAGVMKAPQAAAKAGKAVKAAGEKAVQAGMRAEKALEPAVMRTMERGGLPAQLMQDLTQGSRSQIFIGQKAKTWNSDKAAKAVEMEKAGAAPEEIWKATGTFRGPDGVLRQEIPDHKARLRPYSEMLDQGDKLKARNAEIKQQIAESKAYPDLFPKELAAAQKGLRAEAKANKGLLDDVHGPLANPQTFGNRAGVAYDHPELFEAYPELRDIIVRQGVDLGPNVQGRMAGGQLDMSRIGMAAEPNKTMAHEMQHAVQDIEGFSKGGAPADMRPSQFSPEYTQRMNDAQAAGDFAGFNRARAEARYDAYQRLAGEAEARATENRLHLGKIMRQQTFPMGSYDVPSSGLLFDAADGPALSYEVIPKKLQGRKLAGLPDKVVVDGTEEIYTGFKPAQEAAERYMRDVGMNYNPPSAYVPVDVERARRIAAEYDKMPHAPNDPAVRAAYNKLAEETMAQYDAARRAGVKFDFMPEGKDVYGNPRNALKDIYQNNRMYVFPTESGFGTLGADVTGNPLLQKTGETWGGKPVLVNDAFRAVHDYFGHAKNGVGFRAGGEENAWQAHASMFSPEARRALTSETRGQNSWLNYGPYGDKNRTATTADTIFADQKTGLLPEWVSTEGYGGVALPRYLLDE